MVIFHSYVKLPEGNPVVSVPGREWTHNSPYPPDLPEWLRSPRTGRLHVGFSWAIYNGIPAGKLT